MGWSPVWRLKGLIDVSNDLSRLLFAASFAADRHRDQRRKGPDASPYINHPLAVAALLANDGGIVDVELLIAAVLHDTVEDTNTSVDEIKAAYKKLVKEFHPDVIISKGLPEEFTEFATKRFREIQGAYEVIRKDRGF